MNELSEWKKWPEYSPYTHSCHQQLPAARTSASVEWMCCVSYHFVTGCGRQASHAVIGQRQAAAANQCWSPYGTWPALCHCHMQQHSQDQSATNKRHPVYCLQQTIFIYNLISSKFLPQKLKNGFAAGDARWRVHSVAPPDEHRLCPMSNRSLC